MHSARTILCVLVLASCAAAAARPQPAPELATVPVIAVKAGGSVEIALSGRHLKSLKSVAVVDARGLDVTIVGEPKDDQLRVKLTAAGDAVPGQRRMRLIGPDGVTTSFQVFVSQFEVAPVGDAGDVRDLRLPATITGRVATPGGGQAFRFRATKGELLVFDVWARRIGSPLDVVATVESERGRLMLGNVVRHGGDPTVLFDPPADGAYVLRLRDLRYRGGDYGYRITAGHVPYLESVLPGSGKPGTVVNATPLGYNLDGTGPITIDLSAAAPGRIEVRAKGSLGTSNEIPFEVTDLPQQAEAEPNDRPDESNLVQLPVEISARADHPGDEDFYRFRLPYKQSVSLEVLAARFGSPMVPLVQLQNAKGEAIDVNDGTPDADARIVRELDAGEYVAAVRDLAYGGGPGHWYRLKIEPAWAVRPDFAVRFQPDALRLHRGGSAALWCDVRRASGLRGDITLVPESLPAGVTVSPTTLAEGASGWVTLSATPDAALGTAPLRLGARAMIGAAPVSHEVQAEATARTVVDAYLTVLEPAPFNVETPATFSPQQISQAGARLATSAAKLAAPDPKLEEAEAQWESRLPTEPVWKPLEAASATSAKGTKLLRLSDSSVLAAGSFPDQDEYTITARTNVKGITGVRLEAIADERLPGAGPGTAPNGNFVLTGFSMLAAKEGGAAAAPVMLRRATADFSQDAFPAAAALANNPASGWAVSPRMGQTHAAVFRTGAPLGAGPGTTLTFVLRHASGFAKHNIGRFRISVTTLEPSRLNEVVEIPPDVFRIAKVSAEQRTAQERLRLVSFYRSIDPQTVALRGEVETLRKFVAPYAEIQRLQAAMTAPNPQWDARQKQWEQSLAQGQGWSVLQPVSATSEGAGSLAIDPDGSVFCPGASASADVCRIEATPPLKSVTALRLELLPDPRLPAGGPGRAEDGSFLLTHASVQGRSISGASATAQQNDHGISAAVGDKEGAGWSAGQGNGMPVEATFYLDPVSKGQNGSKLTVTLAQAAGKGVGRFRLWVTSNPQPDVAVRLPANIAALLKVPDAARSPAQKRQVADYYRSTSADLAPVRQRIAELNATTPAMPFRARRNQPATIPVLLKRDDDFKGVVTVTLEGFAPGGPKMTARQIKVTPLTLGPDSPFGLLTLQPEPGADVATRMVVLKAETKTGDDVVTQYSPAFPLTIQN